MKNSFSKIKLYSVIKYHKLHYTNFHKRFFDEKNSELTIKNGINLNKKNI